MIQTSIVTKFSNEFIFLSAHNACFQDHEFAGFKVIVSLRGRFDCELEGERVQGFTGILLNRHCQHRLLAADATVLVYYIDLQSLRNASLSTQLAGQPWLDLSQSVNQLALPGWSVDLDSNFTVARLNVLESLFPNPARPPKRVYPFPHPYTARPGRGPIHGCNSCLISSERIFIGPWW